MILIKKQPLFTKVNNIVMEAKFEKETKVINYKLILTLAIVVVSIFCFILEYRTNDILININEATQNELMLLDGIGEVKANDIIEYRSNKEFERVSELINVVGVKTYDNIKSKVSID